MAEATERTAHAGVKALKRNAESLAAIGAPTPRHKPDCPNTQSISSPNVRPRGETGTKDLQRSSDNLQAAGRTHDHRRRRHLQNVAGESMRSPIAFRRQPGPFRRLHGLPKHPVLSHAADRDRPPHFEALLRSVRRAAELSTHVADEAMRKIAEAPLAPV